MLWLWDRKSFLNPKQNYSIHGFLQCKNLPSLVKILRFILFFIFLSPHFPKQNIASDYQKLSRFSYFPARFQIKKPIQKHNCFHFFYLTPSFNRVYIPQAALSTFWKGGFTYGYFSIFSFASWWKRVSVLRCFSYCKRISSASWTKKLPAGSLFIYAFSPDYGNGFLHFGR